MSQGLDLRGECSNTLRRRRDAVTATSTNEWSPHARLSSGSAATRQAASRPFVVSQSAHLVSSGNAAKRSGWELEDQRSGVNRFAIQPRMGFCLTNVGKSLSTLINFAQSATRHHDVRGKAALNVISRHLLRAADRLQAALAQVALATRQHSRYDHRLANPAFGT